MFREYYGLKLLRGMKALRIKDRADITTEDEACAEAARLHATAEPGHLYVLIDQETGWKFWSDLEAEDL